MMNYYTADVISYSDYYPFGMLMPNRHGQDDDYRYGFNGMESDDEVRGTKGASYDFGARMLDPRIGRWLSVDAYEAKYVGLSPYNFVANMPINAIDPDGKDVIILMNSTGAGSSGHMAMLYQDKDGSWNFFSQGANSGNPLVVFGYDVQAGVTIARLQVNDTRDVLDANGEIRKDANGISIKESYIRDATESEAIEMAKSGQLGDKYDETYKIETTVEEDGLIAKAAKISEKRHNNGDEKYDLYSNNCVDACQNVIEHLTTIKTPVDNDARPNVYFDKLEKEGVTRVEAETIEPKRNPLDPIEPVVDETGAGAPQSKIPK